MNNKTQQIASGSEVTAHWLTCAQALAELTPLKYKDLHPSLSAAALRFIDLWKLKYECNIRYKPLVDAWGLMQVQGENLCQKFDMEVFN